MVNIKMLLRCLVVTAVLAFSFNVFAGGAFYISPENKGGTAYMWSGGVVHYAYDKGNLSDKVWSGVKKPAECEKHIKTYTDPCLALELCGAVKCMDHLFKKWAETTLVTASPGADGAGVVNLQIKNDGPIKQGNSEVEDVTTGNYDDIVKEYVDKASKTTPILIVFDADGSLIEKLDAPGKQKSLLGLTQPWRDKNSANYVGGVMVLNGLFVNGTLGDKNDSSNREPPMEKDGISFASTMLHEIGHALGLDHSQGLMASNGSKATYTDEPDGIPTMYPYLLTGAEDEQYELHSDDRIALASIYPSADFGSKFCVIKGSIKNESGAPYQGLNVIAYSTGENKFIDARSFVSGSLYASDSADSKRGDYILGGIVPCKEYKVVYEPIWSDFHEYTKGMNPYNGTFRGPDETNIPTGVSIMIGGSGKDVAVCRPTGLCDKDIPPDYNVKGMWVVADDGVAPDLAADVDTGDSGSGKKGFCMSITGGFSPSVGLIVPALALLGLIVRRRLKR